MSFTLKQTELTARKKLWITKKRIQLRAQKNLTFTTQKQHSFYLIYPSELEMQEGGKRANPHELTVSK